MSASTANNLLSQLGREKERLVKAGLLTSSKATVTSKVEEAPFRIPDNWTWVCLNQVSIIQEGPGIRKHQSRPDGIQFLTVTNILEGEVDLEKSKKYVSPEEFNSKYRHFKINRDDIVVACSGGSWGKSAIFDCDDTVILNTSTLRLRFFGDLGDNKYLYYLTKADFFNHQIEKQLTGQQPNFGYSHYSIAQIPLPPLAEQQRIVGVLDEAFAGIATAKANTEKNLQNARALFESQLQSAFTRRGKGWKQKTLEEIATTFGRGKSKHRPRNEPKLYGGKYPFVQTGDIRNAEHFITEYSQTYSEVGLAQSKLWPKGTICITIAANIAETSILGFDACFPDSVIGVVANPKEAEVGFVEYLLQSFKARIQAMGKGSAQANINMGTFEHERFPFPPVAEQKQIVAKLDALSEETQRLAKHYERKLELLAALKKSLLNEAFTGKL